MTPWQAEGPGSRVWRVLAWTVLLAFCFFSGMKFAENIVLVQALGGVSPLDWVAHQLFPENFKVDFPSGISAYRMSSVMQLYLFLAEHGVELEAFVPWMVRFEVVFLGIGAAVFFRALAPKSPYVAMAIFAILVVEGSARDMNLARFGGAFYQGFFYNIADGLSLLGLAALLRGQVAIAALLLGVGITVHPVIAAMACLFATPYVLLNFGRFPFRRWVLAGTVFLGVSGLWILIKIQSAEVASGGIPADQWLGLVRMFTYHWFPVDIGVFTRMHERYILPLLCLIGLATLYLPRVIPGRVERLGIALGMLLLAILSIAGVLISEFSSEPFLIKLALHRASDMLILVSLLIVVAGLTDELLNGRFFEGTLGATLILSPVLSAPSPFPIAATVTLAGLHALHGRRMGDTPRFWLAAGVGLVLLLSVSIYFLMGIPNIKGYLGSSVFWSFVLVFAVARIAQRGLVSVRASQAATATGVMGLLVLSCVLGIAVISTSVKSAMPEERKMLATDYLAVQRWAAASTPRDALFMVDPTMGGYGWRDFSHRSAFGHLREWLHTSWLYDSRRALYEEGLRRFGEFGIDIEPYKRIRPSIDGYHRLSDDLRQLLYIKDPDWFENLSRRYGIHYLVLQRKYIKRELRFDKAFENASFVVYRFRD